MGDVKIVHDPQKLILVRGGDNLKTKTKEAKKHDGKECKGPAAPSIGVLGTIVVRLTKGKPERD